jgi:Fur family ferric uptake transcriptional regulator
MYQTKQKNIIINILIENKDKHLNAEEIYMILKKNNASVSLATLYRCLDKLVSENIVRKYNTTHLGKACYQYIDKNCTVHNHFHLVCEKCQ